MTMLNFLAITNGMGWTLVVLLIFKIHKITKEWSKTSMAIQKIHSGTIENMFEHIFKYSENIKNANEPPKREG